MAVTIWQQCTTILEGELSPIQFNTWIKPLHADLDSEQRTVRLLAPNRYIREQVSENFLSRIESLLEDFAVTLTIGTFSDFEGGPASGRRPQESFSPLLELHKEFTFETFVKGSSNELARAAALHVAENMGAATYKCLLLYGGVGLGKTHLMHAVGNAILDRHPGINVAYMYSQRFMEDMVSAIERGAMNEFTEYYRKVDVLLMDDIQFLAKGPKSQEEFFHVFNRLQENGSLIVLTCDRYPKEVEGLEERLQSRFVWGMTAPLDPPELETRVAIVKKKAELERVDLPNEAAFFIAEHIRANVRELEGALQRVVANASFTGREITLEQVKGAIKDLVAIADRQIGIENIKRTVADYYNIRVSDMHSPKRSRSLARPRQVAMALSKELTSHSLPEIGQNFGGRDHTTVLHACRRIDELRESNRTIREDYSNLMRTLTA
ncbi:MAG: chromosomal replication initiator protein DnaA [Gammaproteobacteria bacterium]|nr:chromosomal replication initiator protein DnaA [Gammaproteobacteria bacterium]OUU11429.1 MAG: chromosomal replication initiation protein DnaA [Gammaproteobacteria bacterium TMED34]